MSSAKFAGFCSSWQVLLNHPKSKQTPSPRHQTAILQKKNANRQMWRLYPTTVFCKISVQKNQQCLEFSMNRCRCLLYRRKIAIPTVLWQENDFQYWFHWSFNSILIESTNCWNVNSETSVRDFRVTFTANGQIQVENFSKYKLKENEQNWNLIV